MSTLSQIHECHTLAFMDNGELKAFPTKESALESIRDHTSKLFKGVVITRNFFQWSGEGLRAEAGVMTVLDQVAVPKIVHVLELDSLEQRVNWVARAPLKGKGKYETFTLVCVEGRKAKIFAERQKALESIASKLDALFHSVVITRTLFEWKSSQVAVEAGVVNMEGPFSGRALQEMMQYEGDMSCTEWTAHMTQWKEKQVNAKVDDKIVSYPSEDEVNPSCFSHFTSWFS